MKPNESPVRRGGQGSTLTGRGWLAVVAATVASALVMPIIFVGVALAIAEFQGGLLLFYISLLVSLVWVVALGLPAFFLLRFLGKERMATLSTAGFITGCLPVAVLAWPCEPGAAHSSSGTWHGKSVDLVREGVPTLHGWFSYLEVVVVLGIMGAISAVVFWYVWVYFSHHPQPAVNLSGGGSNIVAPDPRMK